MTKVIARIRVLIGAAPTYLVAASIVVTAVSTEVADAFPGNAATVATKVGGWLLAGIGAATAIVRRVAPVLPHERGLLEPPVKTDPITIKEN